MNHRFICPDCRCSHREPLEATFVLHVRCADCTVLLELTDDAVDGREFLVAAA